MQKALRAGKHGGFEAIFVLLAQTVAQDTQARALAHTCDVIVPIPLAFSRRWQRGYNPSAIVARTLGRLWHRPVEHLLRRAQRRSVPQSCLDARARASNMAGAFARASAAGLVGRGVLLVDDVSTTGATLHAAAAVLLAHGAKRVCAVTIAKQTLEGTQAHSV